MLTDSARRHALAKQFSPMLEFDETMVTGNMTPSPNVRFDSRCELVTDD